MNKVLILVLTSLFLVGCFHNGPVQRDLKEYPPMAKPLWKTFDPPVTPYINQLGEVCTGRSHFNKWVDVDLFNRGQLKQCNDQSKIFNAF